jgi:glycosyltransferase involved in cell wall biosynthesis
VVGNSRYILQRHLKAGYFKKAIKREVIYNAAGINESNKESFKSLPVVRFGFIGRIVPEKGVELLLRVLSQLENQDWDLIIAGSGEESYCASLKKKYTNPRIKWLGWTQPHGFYKQVDFVIVPSLWQEPLSRVIIEAFSYAMPVIASQRGGSPEVIQDGINGFLFDPDDLNSLKKILNRIISKKVDLTEISSNCLKSSAAFSEESLRSSYLQLYKVLTRNNEK